MRIVQLSVHPQGQVYHYVRYCYQPINQADED